MFLKEMDWRTSTAVLELQRTRAPTKQQVQSDDGIGPDFPPNMTQTSALNYQSRLSWGTNFYTGTAGPAAYERMKEAGPVGGAGGGRFRNK